MLFALLSLGLSLKQFSLRFFYARDAEHKKLVRGQLAERETSRASPKIADSVSGAAAATTAATRAVSACACTGTIRKSSSFYSSCAISLWIKHGWSRSFL